MDIRMGLMMRTPKYGKYLSILLAGCITAFLTPVRVYGQIDTLEERTVPDTVSIAAVGDIMLGSNFPSPEFLPPDDGRSLLSPVVEYLKNTDVTFGNCEGTFLDKGGTVKTVHDPKNLYAFRQPRRYAHYLAEAGFTLLNLANNHYGDFGDVGRVSTMLMLDSLGLHYAGVTDRQYVIFERRGVTFGFCGFAPNTGTVDIRNIPHARQIVSMLDTVCDIVIVSMHGGGEGERHAHVKNRTETYLGEDRGNVVQFAHAVIDAGADIVLGHGPHIPRAVELYRDRFIAYSLGNFCTYGQFNLRGKCGLAPILRLHLDGAGTFLNGQIISCKQFGEGGPVPDPDGTAVLEIRDLTLSDFPQTPLMIDTTGVLTRKGK